MKKRTKRPASPRATMAMVKSLRDELFAAGREQRTLEDTIHRLKVERDIIEARLRELHTRFQEVPSVVDTLILSEMELGGTDDADFAVLNTALLTGHTIELRRDPSSRDLWEAHAIRSA